MYSSYSRTLRIDAEVVTFMIELADTVAALREGATLPDPVPTLGAVAIQDGIQVWEGVLSQRAAYGLPITEQFTDQDLERLYRAARIP
jgi:hypothetical protein